MFITGGTGFFGKSMLDYRLRRADFRNDEWTILSRDPDGFRARFPRLAGQPGVSFVSGDVRDIADVILGTKGVKNGGLVVTTTGQMI